MSIPGLPFQHSIGHGDGLAATNAMTVPGIRSGDNVLAVMSWPDAGGSVRGDDADDFTAGNGTLTGATVDLSSRQFTVIWSSDPSS